VKVSRGRSASLLKILERSLGLLHHHTTAAINTSR
jgi:hypothetical protein